MTGFSSTAPPPSYNSLFGQVREARKNSSGVVDFLRKLVVILLGTRKCQLGHNFAI